MSLGSGVNEATAIKFGHLFELHLKDLLVAFSSCPFLVGRCVHELDVAATVLVHGFVVVVAFLRLVCWCCVKLLDHVVPGFSYGAILVGTTAVNEVHGASESEDAADVKLGNWGEAILADEFDGGAG